MDFFAHQDEARRRTKLLLFYYAVAVSFLVLATYAAAIAFLGVKTEQQRTHQRHNVAEPRLEIWDPSVFAICTIATLSVVGLGALWRVIQLRSGGSAVAEMLGGRRVELSPFNDRERMLRNVVEEMAIASG